MSETPDPLVMPEASRRASQRPVPCTRSGTLERDRQGRTDARIAVTDIPAVAVIARRRLRPGRIDVSKAPDPALRLGPETKRRALGFRAPRAIPAGAVLDLGSVDFAAARSSRR